jgi:hypothetical protein
MQRRRLAVISVTRFDRPSRSDRQMAGAAMITDIWWSASPLLPARVAPEPALTVSPADPPGAAVLAAAGKCHRIS